ncbi:MAG TPA: type II toxin-antitoxin system VapB family antitoxin [Thermoanaerobaculia bacterium]|nr:type II toxin-antitoxin system VapB family antitoxin [Thermoanaerobaculia bacterium]
MKRTNVVLDEKLLEDARRVTGEKTYSATITRALEKVVKQQRFRELLVEWEREAAKGGMFHPDYLAEKSANSMFDEPKQRLSADVKRASRPKKKRSVRRVSR